MSRPVRTLVSGLRLDKVFCEPSFEKKWLYKYIEAEMPDYEKYKLKREKMQREYVKADHVVAVTYVEPLLSTEQEQHQFRKFNFYKYRANKLLKLNRQKQAAKWLEKAVEVRNQILVANTRLALNATKKIFDPVVRESLCAELFEPLIRCIEYFDYRKPGAKEGDRIKFSTFSTWALRNHIGRWTQNRMRDIERTVTSELKYFSEPCHDLDDNLDKGDLKSLVSDLLRYVNERSKDLLERRYGLINGEPMTLEAVGKSMSISKERVRQLETKAFQALRQNPNAVRLLRKIEMIQGLDKIPA